MLQLKYTLKYNGNQRQKAVNLLNYTLDFRYIRDPNKNSI